MNKYEHEPDIIVDLHGYTTQEARYELHELIFENDYTHIRIITGKGQHNPDGVGVLRNFVQAYLYEHNISFRPAKREHGGDGAFEVTL